MNRIIVSVIIFLVAPFALAQDEGGGSSNRFSEVNAFLGRVLPNGVSREDEIFSMWGLRYSMPWGASGGYFDFGGTASNGGGVDWKGAFVGISMHIPIETLVGHAGIGVDFIRYEVDDQGPKSSGGGHFVGGVMTRIGGNVLARFDMKLNTKPGTSLFFGLGLTIELDGFGSGGGEGQ